MTSPELKAWFAGLISINPPDKEMPAADLLDLWALVAARIQALNEVPTPYPIFIANFWPFPKRTHWWEWSIGRGQKAPVLNGLSLPEQHVYELSLEDAGRFYDEEEYGRYAGFYALGRAERERMR